MALVHPFKWRGMLTFNLLELLASATPIYITIHQLGQVSHILADKYRGVVLQLLGNSCSCYNNNCITKL